MRPPGQSRVASAAEALPVLGPLVPRRHYGCLQALGSLVLRRLGWRIEGALPDCPKLVAALAPHSSNWDFVIGVSVALALGLRAAFIGKHTLFRWPLGALMRWLGGIPVNRARPDGFADAMIAEFQGREQLWLGIAPEGTRTDGVQFKSGFYRIARAAGVPILPVYLNYQRKVIGFLPLVHADREVDQGVAAVRDLLERHGARKAR